MKDLFDFVNGIQLDQTMDFYDSLSESERKNYRGSRYMINRFLSMNVHYAPLVNEIQKRGTIPDRSHYQFLVNCLPKGKTYDKYVKADKYSAYELWLVELVAKHYQVSKTEARVYIRILYEQRPEELRELCKAYGIEDKELKKVKL